MNYMSIFKRETKVIAYVVIALTIVVLGASYALFFQVNNNRANQVVTAGSLVITYSKDNAVEPADADGSCLTPQSDATGSGAGGCNYKLSIMNTDASLPMKYDLLIYNNSSVPTGGQLLGHDNVKYTLRKSTNNGLSSSVVAGFNGTASTGFLNGITSDTAGKKVLIRDVLQPNESVQYSLNIWIKEDASEDNVGRYVYLNIDVAGEVG